MARLKFSLGILWAISASLLLFPSVSPAQINLKPGGYFETPGFAFLVYQNTYLVGKRGGLEMFLHGRRVLDAGEVVCLGADGRYYAFDSTEIGKQAIDLEKNTCVLPGKIAALDITYKIVARTDGRSIILTTELEKPVDWKKVKKVMLKLEIYPQDYWYRTYYGGASSGYFSERYQGQAVLIPAAKEISIAPEDNLRAFTMTSEDAGLSLIDGLCFAPAFIVPADPDAANHAED
jgi:endoglucanase